MTVHDRAAKSPRVSVASFPGAQKNGRGVPGIHDFQENLETCSRVHVAQPYIIESQESIGTRLVALQVLKCETQPIIYSLLKVQLYNKCTHQQSRYNVQSNI